MGLLDTVKGLLGLGTSGVTPGIITPANLEAMSPAPQAATAVPTLPSTSMPANQVPIDTPQATTGLPRAEAQPVSFAAPTAPSAAQPDASVEDMSLDTEPPATPAPAVPPFPMQPPAESPLPVEPQPPVVEPPVEPPAGPEPMPEEPTTPPPVSPQAPSETL